MKVYHATGITYIKTSGACGFIAKRSRTIFCSRSLSRYTDLQFRNEEYCRLPTRQHPTHNKS